MAKKTTAQLREEVRKIFCGQLEKADFMKDALMFDPAVPKYGVPVEHPELGTVYVSVQVVVKNWADTATKVAFDLEDEHQVYLDEMAIKEKEAAEKKAKAAKKAEADKVRRAKAEEKRKSKEAAKVGGE